MAYLQIRDVPDAVRDVLADRAREKGQSLNMYLRDVVIREASFVNNRALIDQVTAHRRSSGVTTADVLSALDAAREHADA
jgi:hypothetical protein